ncbi:MAG: hypothetical protein AVDCRST_MAG22-2065 [uncultured Rubrobacteraceae bacterium]|uniref:Uncharacterized protein n=1 Tax=uncultured Rubrobacteraceae bacterium TaxID=349277 RepID=A0A6J4PIG5_9ACTN|nr:MAG: hypothetical protein AVDCRST_MAG22-2065 [uncultured Rubrobacteraceae bacterium]
MNALMASGSSSMTARTVATCGLLPVRTKQILAISLRLSAGCSALRSTMRRRTEGGRTRLFAGSEPKRLCKPSSSKPAILR